MTRLRLILVVVLLAGVYVAGPIVAGIFDIGDRLGPVIYPRGFHENLYIMAHEASFHEKPRGPLDTWMYRRPYYYGFPRRLKSHQERDEYIARAERDNPGGRWVALMKEMNRAVTEGK